MYANNTTENAKAKNAALRAALPIDADGWMVIRDAGGAHIYSDVHVQYRADRDASTWDGHHHGYVQGAAARQDDAALIAAAKRAA